MKLRSVESCLFKMSTTACVVLSILFTTSVVQSEPPGRSSVSLSELLNGQKQESTTAVWTGKYFPTPPPPLSTTPLPPRIRYPMGKDPYCDDAKTNLTRDWNGNPWDYTCDFPNNRIIPDFDVQPIEEIENVPKFYSSIHYCMNESITYENPIPTFGPHRPAWPRYGEYTYLPLQRWLHSLEHGGIVMLYHPCAHPLEVNRLRRIVTSCLYRHVISPNQHLTTIRPLALLTWGKRLTMSAVNLNIVRDFIRQNALNGAEKVSRDGQYDKDLIKEASIVSDTEDTDLCPADKFKSLSHEW